MKKFVLFLVLLAVRGASAQQTPVAFTDVNLVPMDREIVIPGQTVVVQGGRITAVGPAAQVAVPAGALRIDGTGKYLMPGLADMHAHLVQPQYYDAISLMYVANGVTTLRVMWGSPDVLAYRQQINAGMRVGPQIFTTGPINDGPTSTWQGSRQLTTFQDGVNAANADAAAGYDATKVYSLLPLPAFQGVVLQARQLGLPVYGHVPGVVGLPGALKGGQISIEHLQGWVPGMITRTDVLNVYLQAQDDTKVIGFIDTGLLPSLIDQTLAARAWNTPTLVVEENIVPGNVILQRLQKPSMKYVPPGIRAGWQTIWTQMESSYTPADFARRDTTLALYSRIVAALDSAGAPLLLGTDAPNPLVVPGFSLHEELQNLVEAGLTPFEALRAGTSEGARSLGRQDRWGTVAVGLRADLLLLQGNPLQDVGNADRREGVMLNGAWYPQAALQARLDQLAASYLQTAAAQGDLAGIGTLLSMGVPVDAPDSTGTTPLMTAAFVGQTMTMSALMKAGASLTATDRNGETPLMVAAFGGQLVPVQMLLAGGAAVNARNARGQTALTQAAAVMQASTGNALVFARYQAVVQALAAAGGTQ